MKDIKLFLFNSLSVTTGLIGFVIIMYIFYNLFYKEKTEPQPETYASNKENLNSVLEDLESVVDDDENLIEELESEPESDGND